MDVLLSVYEVFAVLLGLVIGSFLKVCIQRWPHDRSVVAPRSHCEVCGTGLTWYDNVPVVSWVLLRGKCRTCSTPISATYPLTELLGGLLAWLMYKRIFTGPQDLDLPHAVAFVVFYGFVCMLLVASYVDLRHRIIPDQTSIYAVPFGLAGIWLLDFVGYYGWLSIELWNSAAGAVGCGLLFGLLSAGWIFVRGEEGLGFGDVKLVAMIGAFLGLLPGAFLVLLVGSVIGAFSGAAHFLLTRQRTYLPAGPSYALAAVIYVFYGDILVPRFLPGWASWL